MILSKLTIHGFKSFAKKLELKFDGRITAIVGPNGCGKTNIVDAIRWGLGEQRPSVLRTDRMENVIFGGAQSSRPLGMAEVSVHFDNSRHILPIDYSEVLVTRRLFRSGESEYILNKSQVRLKDVHDLLMDTGIGADAYSVIELKMVEDILSEKAEDRRKLLEEAAGVTKYKHRLRAAMRKLDATRNDLLRVNDIISEVDRSVRSLQRQVQRARRYQILQEEVKGLELACSKKILLDLHARVAPLKNELDSLRKTKDGRTTEITKEEAEIEEFRLHLVEKEKALIQAREALGRTVEKIHQREGDIRVARERSSSLEERISQYGTEIETLKRRLEEQQTHLGVVRGERESLQVRITSTGRIFTNKKKELDVFQQGLNLKRLELNGKKKDIISCLESINRLNGEETELRTKIDSSRGRMERLDEEDAASQDDQARAGKEHAEMEEKIKALAAEREGVSQEKRQGAAKEEKLRVSIEQARERMYKDQGDLELLRGRIAFLRQVVETREGWSDGAKALMKEKPAGLIGALADLVETKKDHRRAVEAGMGEAAKYLVFDTASNAYRAVDLLRRKGGGRATLICLDRVGPSGSSRKSKLSGKHIVGWADALVRCDRKVRPAVEHLLGDLVVVDDFEAARTAVGGSDDRVRAVTLGGDIVTGWGVVQAGDDAGDVGMVGRLQMIEELESRAKALSGTMSKARNRLEEEVKERASLTDELEAMNRRLAEKDEQLLTLDKKMAQVSYEGARAGEGLKRNAEERRKLLEVIESCGDELENLRPRMDALTEEREQIEVQTNQIGNEVERLEEEERVKEEEVHRMNLQVVRLNGEAKNLDFDIERSESLVEDIQKTVSQRRRDIESAGEEIAALSEKTKENESALAEDFEEKDSQEKLMGTRETEYQDLQEKLRVKEREVRDVRRDRDAAAEKTHTLAMEISELEHQAQSLKDRMQEFYETDLETVSLPKAEVNFEEAGEEIEEIKRKIKSLGPVNLVALEEYDREKERLDFLNQQREDLISAEATLKETIQKINQTARQRFGDVFGLVRKNFQETFCRFFKGGEADLRLPEGEDPLEAQVEIIARPAGKHFRDLSLLSGGERALTAISLLFALYLVKPSPFCILDEIDAPLDDANVDRFTRVLNEFAEKTQFIIVTHNKMTMRAAQALYGVTMEEEGVSKVVSVRFDDDA